MASPFYGFIPVNPEALRSISEEMVVSAGGKIIYNAALVGVETVGDKIGVLLAAGKQGLGAGIRGDREVQKTQN